MCCLLVLLNSVIWYINLPSSTLTSFTLLYIISSFVILLRWRCGTRMYIFCFIGKRTYPSVWVAADLDLFSLSLTSHIVQNLGLKLEHFIEKRMNTKRRMRKWKRQAKSKIRRWWAVAVTDFVAKACLQGRICEKVAFPVSKERGKNFKKNSSTVGEVEKQARSFTFVTCALNVENVKNFHPDICCSCT